jgi:hypothetical protein
VLMKREKLEEDKSFKQRNEESKDDSLYRLNDRLLRKTDVALTDPLRLVRLLRHAY